VPVTSWKGNEAFVKVSKDQNARTNGKTQAARPFRSSGLAGYAKNGFIVYVNNDLVHQKR
jgi:hypothetical protein